MRYLPRKTHYEFVVNYVSWWAFWVGDPRYFNDGFLLKTMSVLFKNEKNLLTKDASYLKIVWHCKRQKKINEKKEKKNEKWEKVKQQQ